MIKHRKIVADKRVLIDRARETIERTPNVVFAYLFGGLAQHDIRPLSDVDIAVYVGKGSDLVRGKLDLLGDLIDALGTEEIDLVILNTAPLSLSARVLRNNQILLDRDPFFRHSYESLILREYFDFSVKEDAIFKRRFSLGR
jgi:predicted nucleotidyltransferase